MLPEKSGVYMIRNKVNGMMYIGASKDICRRVKHHMQYKRHLIGKAINEFGEDNFTVTVLEYVSVDKLKLKEQYYLEKFKPFQSYDRGYNTTIRSSHKTDIIQYDLDGNRIQIWNSMCDIENTIQINHSKISECIYGSRKSAGGYQWRLVSDTNPVEPINGPAQPTSISMFSKDGEHIKNFHSYYNAAKILFPNILDDKEISKKAGKISMVCRGLRKSAYGYKWSLV